MKKLITLLLFISLGLSGAFAQCAAPTDFSVSVTSDTIINLKWRKPSPSSKTELEIYTLEGALVKAVVVTDSVLTYKNLPKCQKFVARVKTQCDSTHQSAPSNYVNFATLGCPISTVCIAPTHLAVTVTSDTVVTLKWQKPTAASKIELEIYSADGALVKSVVVTDSVLIYKNLPKCQKFVARVKTQCDSTHQSEPSNYVTFATSGCPIPTVCVAPTNLAVTVTNDTVVTLKWNKPTAASKTELEIYTLEGALVKSVLVTDSVLVYKNLPKCQKFVVRIKTQCDSTHQSAPSNYVNFATTGCGNVCDKVLWSDI